MQEVFEKIKKRIAIVETEACGYSPMTKVASEAELKEIIDDVAEQYNNAWIPVEERLPERNKSVLVYAESRTISGETITMVGACDNGFWFIQDGVDTLGFPCRDYKVIAWQPLPEPYQKKGEREVWGN